MMVGQMMVALSRRFFPILHEIGHVVDLNIQALFGLSDLAVADEYLNHVDARYNWWGTITSGHCVTVAYGCRDRREAFADSFAVFAIDEAWNVIGRSWNPSRDIRVQGYYRYRRVDISSIKTGMTTTLNDYFP